MCPEKTPSCAPPTPNDRPATAVGVAITAEARTWMGTPFHHQAALKGVGCDCAGLIRGVGVACGVLDLPPHRWRPHASYSRTPNPRRMERVLRMLLRPIAIEDLQVGDVLWMGWRPRLPMHLGLLAERGGRYMLIHATADIGRVVEHGLTGDWRARIHSAWRYPGADVEGAHGP